MCHPTPLDSKFVDFLVRTDEKMAEEARAGRCLRCAGALHLNSFRRKPRGMPLEWTEHFTYRLSFDCSVCSKRHTPQSVRFLDRRVYLGVGLEHGSDWCDGNAAADVCRGSRLRVDDGLTAGIDPRRSFCCTDQGISGDRDQRAAQRPG